MIEKYIESLPQPHQLWAAELRSILLNLHPAIEERYKYKVPYYNLGKGLAYINFDKNNELYIGFLGGTKLIDEFGLLEGHGTMVRKYVIRKKADLFHPELNALLQQLVEINLRAFSKKRN
jgi:hypothetical protein